ncbi:MAG: CPBP family intramembrane metalloprotease [Acidimicrobiia bacterium]|nr:CPBP family intramembrane metalloprotease [Acidimicrobiia bacterium]
MSAPLPPSPRRRVVALLEVLLCSSVPTQVLLQLVVAGAGVAPLQAPGVPSLTFIALTQLGDVVLLTGLMVLFLRLDGGRLRDVWLGTRPVLREARLGLALIPAVFITVIVLLNGLIAIAPWLNNVEQNPLEQVADTPGEAAVFAVVVILAGGLREELQRAFLLHRFERYLGGAWLGVVVLSIGFGAGHFLQGWAAMIVTGVLGAFWAVVYLRRRSSVAPVVSHAGFDAIEVARIAARAALGE